MNAGVLEGKAVPFSLVEPVVLPLLQTERIQGHL